MWTSKLMLQSETMNSKNLWSRNKRDARRQTTAVNLSVVYKRRTTENWDIKKATEERNIKRDHRIAVGNPIRKPGQEIDRKTRKGNQNKIKYTIWHWMTYASASIWTCKKVFFF